MAAKRRRQAVQIHDKLTTLNSQRALNNLAPHRFGLAKERVVDRRKHDHTVAGFGKRRQNVAEAVDDAVGVANPRGVNFPAVPAAELLDLTPTRARALPRHEHLADRLRTVPQELAYRVEAVDQLQRS